MKYSSRTLPVLLLLAGLTLTGVTEAFSQEGARYTVTFKSTWTPTSHPFEYPSSGLLSGPHFSGLIGATHAEGYELFKEGMAPTPGLEKLSEEGKHSPLDAEIKAAIKAGKAGTLFETGPIKDATAMTAEMTEIMISDTYPMISAVAMIAPSPDWFGGVMNVNLKENGGWVEKKTVELYAYDSGGDDGATYKASDVDTNPKKPTTKAMNRHFVVDGKARSVATLTFTLKK